LISVLLVVISCINETILPDEYEIIFSNEYFETLNSIEIADKKIEVINIGDEVTISSVPRGQQEITVITHSGLIMKATVNLTGTNPVVRIVLTESGMLQLV